MKNRIVSIVALILMLTATTAYAQSNQIVKANIPFEFEMQGKTLPAGEYVLRRQDARGGIWSLAGKSVKSSAIHLLPITIDKNDRAETAKITFRRYGNRYFLAAAATTDYEITLPKSKREQAVQREFQSDNKLAKAEIVTIEVAVE